MLDVGKWADTLTTCALLNTRAFVIPSSTAKEVANLGSNTRVVYIYVEENSVASTNRSVLSGSAGHSRRHDSEKPTIRSLLAAMEKLDGTGLRTTGKQAFASSTPVRG